MLPVQPQWLCRGRASRAQSQAFCPQNPRLPQPVARPCSEATAMTKAAGRSPAEAGRRGSFWKPHRCVNEAGHRGRSQGQGREMPLWRTGSCPRELLTPRRSQAAAACLLLSAGGSELCRRLGQRWGATLTTAGWGRTWMDLLRRPAIT